VAFLQTAEVDGVKNIAVEDEFTGRKFAPSDRMQKTTQTSRLTILAAQVNIRDDNCVGHESRVISGIRGGGRMNNRGFLLCIANGTASPLEAQKDAKFF